MDLLIVLPVLFFVIAVFYSAAGFGGGSSYLAILALCNLPFLEMRMIALICNVVVVLGSSYLFYKAGYVKWRKILPLILWSIPFAYLGGSISTTQEFFTLILGFTLLIAALIMLFSSTKKIRELPSYTNYALGSGIGLLSGFVGIGGGIFLAPVLHISAWDKAKVIAATTSVFILVNSIAGIIGQWNANEIVLDYKLALFLIISVAIGGQIGSRITIKKLNPSMVRRVTAILVLLVSIRLLLSFFGIFVG